MLPVWHKERLTAKVRRIIREARSGPDWKGWDKRTRVYYIISTLSEDDEILGWKVRDSDIEKTVSSLV